MNVRTGFPDNWNGVLAALSFPQAAKCFRFSPVGAHVAGLLLLGLLGPCAGVFAGEAGSPKASEPAESGEESGTKRVERILAPEDAAMGAKGPGQTITIRIQDRPLKLVLEYLSAVSGVNVRALNEKVERLPVTVDLENVGHLAVLDFIAKKYGLMTEQISPKLIMVSLPEKVSMVFNRADIRDVINTIAIQADANIVVGPEISGEISMRLENVPWHEALDIVVKTLDFVAVREANDTIRITTPGKLETQRETRIFRLAYVTPEGAKYTATIDTNYARRQESEAVGKAGTSMIDMLANMKGPGGSLSFVKHGNSLIVTDTPTNLNSMQAVINKLDTPPKQIHVSLKIVAMTDSDVERLGVNWSNGLQFQVTPLSSWPTAFPFDVTKGLTRSLLGDLAVGARPVNAINKTTNVVTPSVDIYSLRNAFKSGGIGADGAGPLGNTVFNTPGAIAFGSMGFGGTTALFEMIRTKTSSRIVQSPQLMTLDNEEATLQVGQLIRYAESFVANTEGGGNVSGFREARGSPINEGLQMLIIPHVTGPENNILMTAIPKTEELIEFRDFVGPNGIVLSLPQTRQRIVVNKMLLRNGETGVIGGLRIERDSRSQNHLPVFSQIPILGRLFKHRSQSVTGESLMLFITPTIVDFGLPTDFQDGLDNLRKEMSKPFAPLGDEEDDLSAEGE